jgi:hypothetical protein
MKKTLKCWICDGTNPKCDTCNGTGWVEAIVHDEKPPDLGIHVKSDAKIRDKLS